MDALLNDPPLKVAPDDVECPMLAVLAECVAVKLLPAEKVEAWAALAVPMLWLALAPDDAAEFAESVLAT